MPVVEDVNREADSGVQGSTRATTSAANLTQKSNTNGPAAKVAFLGGSSDGVLDHQDDSNEEEGADHLNDESSKRALAVGNGEILVVDIGVRCGLKNGDSS